jgi:hypothetical protein
VLVWQLSQGALVAICFCGLPIASVLLWHVAHAAVSPEWLKRAPANEWVLLWQLSHGALVRTCFNGLPDAVLPSWQEAQAPRAVA